MQIQVDKILDVEVVERQLTELWKQTSGGAAADDDFAVLRARVANLLVFVGDEPGLQEVNAIIAELTAMHPSRVLLLLGAKHAADRDIEMAVETFCQTDKRTGAKRLCCEEITLRASGSFVSELPSAALPLVVPDLTTFLWWREALASGLASDLAAEKESPDKVFDALLRASERLIVDSAEFLDPQTDLLALTKFFRAPGYGHVGISDLNWARLTSWRALLAGFYDVEAYQPLLDSVDTVRIDYIAPAPPPVRKDVGAHNANSIAPQALLIAGWLASRLGWKLESNQTTPANDDSLVLTFSSQNRGGGPNFTEGVSGSLIKLELNRVEHAEGKPGRLVQVVLQSTSAQAASFAVARSADNLHLTTEARVNEDVQRGRVVPVRNRSAAQLLGREMEILCNDRIYQDALTIACSLLKAEAPGKK